MPLLFQSPLRPPGEWGLWHITESESDLLADLRVFPAEMERLSAIRGEGRRREYLAARLLLHRMSGRERRGELTKDADGKPHLADSDFYVSISHTVDYAAAVAHPQPCGVDVQRIVARIHRIAPRFASSRELDALRPDSELTDLHLLWSAKEAVYKAYGRRELDFRDHLSVDLAAGRARLEKGELVLDYALEMKVFEDFVLVASVLDASLGDG